MSTLRPGLYRHFKGNLYRCLLYTSQSRVRIAGYTDQPLSQLVTRAVDQICQYAAESAGL